MGYQFAHIEGYGKRGAVRRDPKTGRTTRQRSASECGAEAMREDGACPHVAAPQPPRPVFGCTPGEAAAQAEAWADQATDAAGRKYRDTSPALLGGVVSMERGDDATWDAYKVAVVEHLQERYGARLLSVVEHVDEANPHIHFYAVPLPGEKFDVLHPGRAAAAEAAAQGLKKGEQMKAYADAMRTWQDELHAACGAAHGLTRIGPGRQRLSRGQWQAQKAQAEALAKVEAVATAAHRRGWREGKQEGFEAGRAEALAAASKSLARVGGALGGLAARAVGQWHKPTQQAEQEAQTARKQAEAHRKARKAAEARIDAVQAVLHDNNTRIDAALLAAKTAKAEAANTRTENEALRAEIQRLRP
ncbi:plasmid recombination protein, partial [Pandoraea sp. PE-S2T-3]|uniref:plasmid recombination protein n=1 Tax=Pandoraea sp. PE-S2T-3 TaxID=1986993 RepID=UPI000B4016CC